MIDPNSNRRSILKRTGIALTGGIVYPSVAAAKGEPEDSSSNSTCKDGSCTVVVASSDEIDVAKYTHEGTTYVYWINKETNEIHYKTVPAGTVDASRFQSMDLRGRAPITFDEEVAVERAEGYYDSYIGSCGSVYSHHEAAGMAIETGDDLVSYTAGAVGGLICYYVPVAGPLISAGCSLVTTMVFDALDLGSSAELTFWSWDIDTGSADLPEVAISGITDYGASLDDVQDQGRFGSLDGAHISGA